MSFASLLKTDLSSLPIRLLTTTGSELPGLRTIGKGDLVSQKDEDGNILKIIGRAFLKVTGFILNVGAGFLVVFLLALLLGLFRQLIPS
ncbi:hypothetical protein IQ218_00940 [Synechocystis salina LEGE 06099]|uniref:hypothetical protein n=1 Tax=Synechocystis salina TaxID=945780 RepID=UPI00187E2040|nr:hypothetical protein [Synechocystis salina]MBE9202301.1 hypothetical protein [Synechocystis salina LEGE 06099]